MFVIHSSSELALAHLDCAWIQEALSLLQTEQETEGHDMQRVVQLNIVVLVIL